MVSKVKIEKEEMGAVIVIKPYKDKFCVARFSMEKTSLVHISSVKPKLDMVQFVDNVSGCVSCLLRFEKNSVDEVLFDESVYEYAAKIIEEKTKLKVVSFVEKYKVHERIAEQKEWIEKNIYFFKTGNEDYGCFLNIKNGYKEDCENCDPMAMDLLAAAARHFRQKM